MRNSLTVDLTSDLTVDLTFDLSSESVKVSRGQLRSVSLSLAISGENLLKNQLPSDYD